MRNQFIQSLLIAQEKYGNIFLLVADVGYSVIEPFQSSYPENFYNIGCAEQNMAGIAAGIASDGYNVFCYSIGNFNTFRCAEQIRNDIDYHQLPVCTVSVGGGVSYGNMGYSHHSIQDYALMRCMPNMMLCAPCDSLETSLCIDKILKDKIPSYLRLHKAGEPQICVNRTEIKPGEPRFLAGNKEAKIALLTTGYTAQAIYDLYSDSKLYAIYTLPCWGHRFRGYIKDFASKYSLIYTYEDHLLDGGFGSWILESLIGHNDISKIRVKSLNSNLIDMVADEASIHSSSDLYSVSLNEL